MSHLADKRGGVELARKALNTEASMSTLKRESNIIRGVFKQAVREGILKPSDSRASHACLNIALANTKYFGLGSSVLTTSANALSILPRRMNFP